MTREEIFTICKLLRKETGCGMMKAKKELDKVIENLKKDSLSTLVLHIDKPESKELDEAAEEYIKMGHLEPEAFLVKPCFKAGAEWYASQISKLLHNIDEVAEEFSEWAKE